MMEVKYLLKVEPQANNNKYYKMIPHGSTWTAEYGRVGAKPQKREYNESQWQSKYNEKIRKGYTDRTDLVSDLIGKEKTEDDGYQEIEDRAVATVVERLIKMADRAIADNYTIASDKVTQTMIDEAQHALVRLTNTAAGSDMDDFNELLLNLFTIIPRAMGKVSDNIAKSADDFSEIIQKEQDLLDVMKGKVVEKEKMERKKETAGSNNCTILEAMGLEMSPCTASDIRLIKKNLGGCADKFRQAWRVKNLATAAKYDAYVKEHDIKDTRLLWHGSRNENWWSIINTGLVLKPTSAVITGKMFGYGIYYAIKARKSLGYTSLSGSRWAGGHSNTAFMALMEVAYGKPYDVYSFRDEYSKLNYQKLQAKCPGADCLHAHAGTMLYNDEIVVYKEDQCTIRYLVELGS